MFQDAFASLDPRMRVRSILSEPLAVQNAVRPRGRRRQVLRILDEVGLAGDAASRYPREFSGGQRQRLALARALIQRPALIVADEPVSALDVSVQAQILNLMRKLQRQYGLSYLFISHDLSVIRYMADMIGVMYFGKLVEVGPAEDVCTTPAHPYTAGLIAAVPVVTGTSAAPGLSAGPARGRRSRLKWPRSWQSHPLAAGSAPGALPPATSAPSRSRHCGHTRQAISLSRATSRCGRRFTRPVRCLKALPSSMVQAAAAPCSTDVCRRVISHLVPERPHAISRFLRACRGRDRFLCRVRTQDSGC